MVITLSLFELTVVVVLICGLFYSTISFYLKYDKLDIEVTKLEIKVDLALERIQRTDALLQQSVDGLVNEVNKHTEALTRLNKLPCAAKLALEDIDEDEIKEAIKNTTASIRFVLGNIFGAPPDSDDEKPQIKTLNEQLKEAIANEDFELAQTLQLKIDAKKNRKKTP